MSKEVTTNDHGIRLYWIYDSKNWFMGGGLALKDKDSLPHLKYCKKTDPAARVEWEPGSFTYEEAYVVARRKAEDIQRTQPGVRDSFADWKRDWRIARYVKKHNQLGQVAGEAQRATLYRVANYREIVNSQKIECKSELSELTPIPNYCVRAGEVTTGETNSLNSPLGTKTGELAKQGHLEGTDDTPSF